MHGALYYRHLEKDKSLALIRTKGNFDDLMSLPHHAKSELHWWIQHVGDAYNVINHSQPQYQITTDASLMGWEAEFAGVSSGVNWSHSESKHQINYLEMLAILLGLQTFAKEKSDTHIRIMCDNTTAVTVVNHMGTSHSDSCNSVAKEIWEWCIDRKVWLSAAHIPGKQNSAEKKKTIFSLKKSVPAKVSGHLLAIDKFTDLKFQLSIFQLSLLCRQLKF